MVRLIYDQVTLRQSADGAIEKNWVNNALELGISVGMSDLKEVKPEDIYTTRFVPVRYE